MVRKAGRQADLEVSAVRGDALALGYNAFANICDVEQAKLYILKGTPRRRDPFWNELLFSDRSSKREGADRIRGLLAGI